MNDQQLHTWLETVDGVVTELQAELERTRGERDVYRAALQRLAVENSGGWGWIAHDALRAGERTARGVEG